MPSDRWFIRLGYIPRPEAAGAEGFSHLHEHAGDPASLDAEVRRLLFLADQLHGARHVVTATITEDRRGREPEQLELPEGDDSETTIPAEHGIADAIAKAWKALRDLLPPEPTIPWGTGTRPLSSVGLVVPEGWGAYDEDATSIARPEHIPVYMSPYVDAPIWVSLPLPVSGPYWPILPQGDEQIALPEDFVRDIFDALRHRKSR